MILEIRDYYLYLFRANFIACGLVLAAVVIDMIQWTKNAGTSIPKLFINVSEPFVELEAQPGVYFLRTFISDNITCVLPVLAFTVFFCEPLSKFNWVTLKCLMFILNMENHSKIYKATTLLRSDDQEELFTEIFNDLLIGRLDKKYYSVFVAFILICSSVFYTTFITFYCTYDLIFHIVLSYRTDDGKHRNKEKPAKKVENNEKYDQVVNLPERQADLRRYYC